MKGRLDLPGKLDDTGANSFVISGNAVPAPHLECGLYVVSTPIGNLGDISIRALQTLAAAQTVACEDKRVSARLLDRYGIRAPRLVAYHEHNAEKAGPDLLSRVAAGETVALVSDAGTPLISDPGQRLVAEAKAKNLPVFAIPGASAPLAALAASGMATEEFTFAGFLPNKSGARKATLEGFASHRGTLAFFEGPSRLAACLADMAEVLGPNRQAAVCRELTKMHEEVRRAGLEELAQYYAANPAKGEIVVLVAPRNEEAAVDADQLLSELMETMPVSRAAGEAAKLTGLPKRDLYNRALQLRDTAERDDG